jgi:uridylate kinase
MIYVIKLPGAGMITKRASGSPLPWLSYRDYRIDAQFYANLFTHISKNGHQHKFVIVAGGVASHLQMNLVTDLGLSKDEKQSVGVENVRILQRIFLAHCTLYGYRAYPSLVDDKDIRMRIKDDNLLYFLEPSTAYQSTDSLCAAAADAVSADMLVLFKARVPVYTVGFDEETSVLKWHISDFASRAKAFEDSGEGNYILDLESLTRIQQQRIRTYLLNPLNYLDLFRIEASLHATEILL